MDNKLSTLLERFECSGPVDAQTIETVERALGVRFPRSYRDFLPRFGAAVGSGGGFAGIVTLPNDPPYWDDIRHATNLLRSQANLPHEYIPVADDGGDYHFYLDTSRVCEDECPVIVLGPGRDGTVVASSFEEFAVCWIRDDMRY